MSPSTILTRIATVADLEQIATLFYETITNVNAKDYNAEEIQLWSTRDQKFWQRRFSEQHFIIAESDGEILGFTSLTESGYIDFMYVHKDYQGQHIGKMLLQEIEKYAYEMGIDEIHSHVSVTAKPFFVKHGFILVKEKRKKISGTFENYAMQKYLD